MRMESSYRKNSRGSKCTYMHVYCRGMLYQRSIMHKYIHLHTKHIVYFIPLTHSTIVTVEAPLGKLTKEQEEDWANTPPTIQSPQAPPPRKASRVRRSSLMRSASPNTPQTRSSNLSQSHTRSSNLSQSQTRSSNLSQLQTRSSNLSQSQTRSSNLSQSSQRSSNYVHSSNPTSSSRRSSNIAPPRKSSSAYNTSSHIPSSSRKSSNASPYYNSSTPPSNHTLQSTQRRQQFKHQDSYIRRNTKNALAETPRDARAMTVDEERAWADTPPNISYPSSLQNDKP